MESGPGQKRIYTVSRLNQEVQQLLEQGFGTLWLQGELSNLARPASGHLYFSLKDSQAQIRCAMFKGRARYLDHRPENGDAVLVRGKLGLYRARGDFQLIVEHLEPAGAGKLQARFEATRKQLDAQGWFAMEHKQPVPAMPSTIGVVTSPSGAALRDVLQVLVRRYPQARVVLYPTRVQGSGADVEIARALALAGARRDAEVLLLVRGGGSLEDLWNFNELTVASAIRECPLPIVSGVGHEVDITIADLVADLRAPTPSAAAELASPDGQALARRATQARQQLEQALERRLRQSGQSLASLQARLQARQPARMLREQSQRTDDLEARLLRALQTRLERQTARLDTWRLRLYRQSPDRQLERSQARLATSRQRLEAALNKRLESYRHQLQVLGRTLHSVSPLATLERGFSVARHRGRILRATDDLKTGDVIHTRLARGEIESTVSRCVDSSDPETGSTS